MGNYRVGWFAEGVHYPYNMPPFYNDGKWYAVDYKYFNPWAPVINPKFALSLLQFRYLRRGYSGSALHRDLPSHLISNIRNWNTSLRRDSESLPTAS